MLAIGLMSGTSLDGVDASLVEITCVGTKTEYLEKSFVFVPYTEKLKAKILEVSRLNTSNVQKICSLNFELGYIYKEAVDELLKTSKIDISNITFIAMHGQTIWHNPDKRDGYYSSTLQIGEPSVVAYAFNKLVISNFRTMDMAAGGSGAPLVPFVNYILHKSDTQSIALQNIGGISNVTYIRKGATIDDVIAFDTGPGNMLIDQAMRKLYNKEYDENGKPARLDAVVLSTQHDPEVSQEQIHEDIKEYVFDTVLPQDMIDENTKFFVNPTGRFVIGGPHGDSGLTGRKIIVDTYGGYARHGGGAFSGKDCTKVDRSAAYAARYVAKNIVAAGLADKCEIQLSYAIGVAHPTSVMVDTFGTGKLSDEKLVEIIRENFDLRPAGIIKMLDLRRPIYKQTAAYGHFGRNDIDVPWEKTDKVEMLKKYM